MADQANHLVAHPQSLGLSELTPEQAALLPGAERAPVSEQRGQNEGDADHHVAHPVPLWMLFATFAVLMGLTGATVGVTYLELGAFNVWLALIIAGIKGLFVAVIFMHLRWDNPFNAMAIVATFFFLVVFIGFVCVDTKSYDNLKEPSGGYASPIEIIP